MRNVRKSLELMAAAGLALALGSVAAFANGGFGNETINYSYDAKGRLVKVEHSGTINNNVVSNYSFDKTDNRLNVNVSGAP